MAHEYDHKTAGDAMLIYKMVRNRLPFIADNVANTTLLSNYTWEVMHQIEVCFKIAEQESPNNVVGLEGNYSALQQSIIADLVAVYVLLMQAAGGYDFTSGGGGGSSAPATYIKKAKAGSAEVEYDQFDTSKSTTSTAIGSKSLLEYFKKNAINKAAQNGCIIEICDDCSLTIQGMAVQPQPFIVVTPDCGCS